MTYTPPPSPGQPYSPQPGAWPPAAAPAKSRRGLVIGLVIGAAVAVLLCAGCVTAGVVYYLDGRSTDSGPVNDAAGLGTTPPPGADYSSCGATSRPAEPMSKAVGMPPFASARRSGTATMRITTNLGPITIAMDRAATPCTVTSFEHLAAKHFLDGSPCHRLVTEGLSILQCGDPLGTGMGRPDYAFEDENLAGARYTRGVVAMANSGPGTNGSQFFIVFQEGELDPLYTPFGTVTAGLEVVDKVAAGGHDNSIAGGGGKPNIDITIQALSVE